MTHDAQGDGVDFVVGEETVDAPALVGSGSADQPKVSAGAPEALGGDSPWPPRRTAVVVGTALTALALVLAGVAVHGHRHPAGRAVAASTSSKATASATPALRTSVAAPVPGFPSGAGSGPVFDALPSVTLPPACPAGKHGVTCGHASSVPAVFRGAVRERFPALRQRSASTVSVRHAGTKVRAGLWSRNYVAVGGGLTLRIYVSRGVVLNPVPVASLDDGSTVTVYCEQSSDGYTVQVQVTAVSGRVVDTDTVAGLANDSRLLGRG